MSQRPLGMTQPHTLRRPGANLLVAQSLTGTGTALLVTLLPNVAAIIAVQLLTPAPTLLVALLPLGLVSPTPADSEVSVREVSIWTQVRNGERR